MCELPLSLRPSDSCRQHSPDRASAVTQKSLREEARFSFGSFGGGGEERLGDLRCGRPGGEPAGGDGGAELRERPAGGGVRPHAVGDALLDPRPQQRQPLPAPRPLQAAALCQLFAPGQSSARDGKTEDEQRLTCAWNRWACRQTRAIEPRERELQVWTTGVQSGVRGALKGSAER